MIKVAALACLPVAALFFSLLVMAVLAIPRVVHDFEVGAAALSLVLAAPAAWLVARRMLTRREKRLPDAHPGMGC